jgi:hypothetical protein
MPGQNNGRLPVFLLFENPVFGFRILEFQITAPGGFSAFPVDPAHTFPGSLTPGQGLLVHISAFGSNQINYATETPDGQG